MQPDQIKLTPGKRVLFLTKDFELIRRQLSGELNLRIDDVDPKDLLDDINTDVMTPAWVCFSHKPEDLARDAYAGLIQDGKRVMETDALIKGNFEVIVSGERKGTGSSRETAAQAERWAGIKIVIAASFAPIHARNNINIGTLMGDYAILRRLQNGESIPLEDFLNDYDDITKLIIRHGGLFPFGRKLKAGEVEIPRPTTEKRPMTMAEKAIASHLVGGEGYVKPGDAVLARVDGGYSHEFTTAQVHYFLQAEYGDDYTIPDPSKFAVFEDHLIYADGVPRMARFGEKIETLRQLQREFQKHTGVRDYSAVDKRSPGICHQVAREHFIEPGDLILATDSHTTMGGGNNAYAYGVGATDYAGLISAGFAPMVVPESIRFELAGELPPNVTAKDVMLYILLNYAKTEKTLNRAMEFAGPGLFKMSPDERATLANMATECSARAGMCESDDVLLHWIAARRPGADIAKLRARAITADPGAQYDGGVHTIDLSALTPMVAHPGDPEKGIASDPTNGAYIADIGDVKIDIAYAGSCTAGKEDDLAMYARVLKEAADAGRRIADGVNFYIQFGSADVQRVCNERGYVDIFNKVGAQVINPGCGACIGCGPGVSETGDNVTVSAINRNYPGRSGPGKMWLASPLTVAASAITGRITAYQPGMFQNGS